MSCKSGGAQLFKGLLKAKSHQFTKTKVGNLWHWVLWKHGSIMWTTAEKWDTLERKKAKHKAENWQIAGEPKTYKELVKVNGS